MSGTPGRVQQAREAQRQRSISTSTDPIVRRDQGHTYGVALRRVAKRPWVMAALAALAAGTVATLLSGMWRVGATVAIVVLLAYVGYSARRRSEVPQWRRASMAQRRTEAQLRVMKRFGYRVLHARSVPGGNGVIDHFVVGRRGAFAIDSETWDKRLPLHNKMEKLYHGNIPKNDRLDEALEEARLAQSLISAELNREIFVRPSLVIYGPTMSWDVHRLRGIDVLPGHKVRKWLRAGDDRLTETEIDQIYTAAQEVLPSRY